MRTLIVVPTHNESANVGEILDRLGQHVPDADVVVVDDVSTDETRDIVRARLAGQRNLRLIERNHKGGLGDAYLHAFRLGLDEGYDALVEIDADLSHDPAILPYDARRRRARDRIW